MQKSLHINPDKCTGCLQCEMACSYENYGVFAPAKSRIKVFNFHETGRKVPYTCTQCGKVQKCDLCCGAPACATACPTGAITFIDSNWTGLSKMQAWADKLGNQAAA